TTRRYGSLVILRSDDNGRTWTTPRNRRTGILLSEGPYHCAPVPVVVHDGRIWRAMEDAMGSGGWGHHFRAFMMSARVEADLLDAENWISSNCLSRGSGWLEKRFGGWLEGNAVISPKGEIVNILRVDFRPEGGKAAMIRVSADGRTSSFNPEDDFIDFPGGCKKFTIRFDPATRHYWALTNYIPLSQRNDNPERTRNTVALITSTNLKDWEVRGIVLYHPDREKHGFQYLDWQFEADDIVAVSRTAFDDDAGGAKNQHDANFITFHRVRGFRKFRMEDSVALP
ncbi:MAG: exo-alpha-sialidase, partial [bacterium]